MVVNSGQSQKLAVGSTVEQYTMAAIKNASHPMTLSTILYFFIYFCVKSYLGAKILKISQFAALMQMLFLGRGFFFIFFSDFMEGIDSLDGLEFLDFLDSIEALDSLDSIDFLDSLDDLEKADGF